MSSVQLQLRDAVARLEATNPRIYIGRDSSVCGLATSDGSVSRRHAEIYLHGEQTFIRDLGSSNGTWVDGAPVGAQPVELRPGQTIYIGHVPLGIEWLGAGGGATVMAVTVPPELKALMEARQRQMMQAAPAAPAYVPPQYAPPPMSAPYAAAPPQYQQPSAQFGAVAPSSASQQFPAAASQQFPAAAPTGQPAQDLGVGGAAAPLPSDLAYRRQGSNGNGVLLIALKHDTFTNDSVVDGFLEFTALDNETVASVTIDLVECHKKGPHGGHVWDRMLVRQGPWKARKGNVLPMPFQLRVPPGTSNTGRDVNWELRGYVDINWALDIEATSPINMRNLDVEKIRDALGALDYRIVELDPKPLGQRYEGKFQPPPQMRQQLGIANIDLVLEYLGSNLQVGMKIDKTKLFKFDKRTQFVFELTRLRSAPIAELSQYFQGEINKMMA